MTLSELAYRISDLKHEYLAGILLAYVTDLTIFEPFETLPAYVVKRYDMIMEFIDEYEKGGSQYAYIHANRQDTETV